MDSAHSSKAHAPREIRAAEEQAKWTIEALPAGPSVWGPLHGTRFQKA